MLPDFNIPIDDKHAAYFWLDEWQARFLQTKDHAFKEQAEAMEKYIDRNFPHDDDEDGIGGIYY